MLFQTFAIDQLLSENITTAKQDLYILSMVSRWDVLRTMEENTALAILAVSNGCFASRAWYLPDI